MDTLKSYWLSLPVSERGTFAAQCGTTKNHINNIVYGQRSPSETLAIELERASLGEVKIASTHPALASALYRAGYTKRTRTPKPPAEQSALPAE